MKKNRILVTAVTLMCVLSLGACGSSDDTRRLTDSEYAQVANYAAGLLLRYAKNTGDRMTYLDTAYLPEHLADAGSVEEAVTTPVTEVPATPVQPEPPVQQETQAQEEESGTEEAQEPADEGGTEDTDGTEPPEETVQTPENEGGETSEPPAEAQTDTQTPAEQPVETGTSNVTANAVSMENSSLQRIADGITVEYTGYSVRNAYPDSQTQGAVVAGNGDKLLVVDFSIHNFSGGIAAFNTARINPQFKLVINGDVQGFTMVTMIANDLGGMDVTLAPGASADAVLLMQLPESLAKSVDTLDLIVVRGAEQQTIRLE